MLKVIQSGPLSGTLFYLHLKNATKHGYEQICFEFARLINFKLSPTRIISRKLIIYWRAYDKVSSCLRTVGRNKLDVTVAFSAIQRGGLLRWQSTKLFNMTFIFRVSNLKH